MPLAVVLAACGGISDRDRYSLDSGAERPSDDGGGDGGNGGDGGSEAAPADGGGGTGGSLEESGGSGGTLPGSGGDAGSGGSQAPAPDGGAEPDPVPPAGDPGRVVPEPEDEAAFLWDDDALRTFHIRLSESDLAFLDSSPAAEQYVPAELVFEGKTYGPAGMRYKGSVGAFLRPCTNASIIGPRDGPRVGKCSIKLSFNWTDPDGTFFGLRKLQFHSMGQDPSMMRERLAYSLFREMGVAAPRAVHARVLINGQFAGVFALIEQIDGRFTRSRFTEGGKGNLYKEVWPTYDDPNVYLNALETNEDENPSVQQMLDFNAAIDLGGEAALKWVDEDLLARYLAVDRVIINDDGIMHFWCVGGGNGNNPGPWGNHNYYWYFAEDSSRAWLIPWDMDSSMNRDAFVQVYSPWTAQGVACACTSYPQQTFPPVPQYPPSCDPVVSGWASTLRNKYEGAVDELLAGPFSEDAVNAKLGAWTEQIRDEVSEQSDRAIIASEDGVVTPDDWAVAVDELRRLIQSMRENRGYPY